MFAVRSDPNLTSKSCKHSSNKILFSVFRDSTSQHQQIIELSFPIFRFNRSTRSCPQFSVIPLHKINKILSLVFRDSTSQDQQDIVLSFP